VRLLVLCDIRRTIFAVIFFLPLRGLSLKLPRANARFTQSSSAALCGGVNTFGHGLSIVLSLMHPHTCHEALLGRVTACVSAIRKTQPNSVAAAYHVCTILDTVAKLPFYIVLRAVLCCVNFICFWGAYCVRVRGILAQTVYLYTIINYKHLCNVLMNNEMQNSYIYLLNSFLSALHVSNESSRSSSGAEHNILYYTVLYNRYNRAVSTVVPIVLCDTVYYALFLMMND
jgi:hypothetical protein